ncbi:hypothetical protein V1264_024462 [Littorina saxatilis]|uniref:Uncharacterized protein n=1 Tax=Littorina saxatilis TaxID=31220 RepID=A0AAN9ALN5_9CAEN
MKGVSVEPASMKYPVYSGIITLNSVECVSCCRSFGEDTMGSEQSQANRRIVCQAGVLVSDGKNIKQLVDIRQDTSYTNHDLRSMISMMSKDAQAAEKQFEIAISGVNALAEQRALQHVSHNGQN